MHIGLEAKILRFLAQISQAELVLKKVDGSWIDRLCRALCVELFVPSTLNIISNRILCIVMDEKDI